MGIRLIVNEIKVLLIPRVSIFGSISCDFLPLDPVGQLFHNES